VHRLRGQPGEVISHGDGTVSRQYRFGVPQDSQVIVETQGKQTKWLIWVGLGLTLALLALALVLAMLRLRADGFAPPPVYGRVAEFTLTNQLGSAVSLGDLRGHVWVADIIFTRCAGPCLRMSRQMKQLQEALPRDSQAKLVSLTTDPEYDQPPVLRTYAQRFGADPARWMFLTGTKEQLARLATDSLKLTSTEKKPEERENPADLFIHSTILVLVDKQGQLRGIFQTDGQDLPPDRNGDSKAEILALVRRLERER
jgi:protein SCO1